jgi:hypothetical protein
MRIEVGLFSLHPRFKKFLHKALSKVVSEDWVNYCKQQQKLVEVEIQPVRKLTNSTEKKIKEELRKTMLEGIKDIFKIKELNFNPPPIEDIYDNTISFKMELKIGNKGDRGLLVLLPTAFEVWLNHKKEQILDIVVVYEGFKRIRNNECFDKLSVEFAKATLYFLLEGLKGKGVLN